MDYLQNLSGSDRRWYDLIQQCRTSGKSDRQWLDENNISSATFYYHVKKLREKACEIPASISSGQSETQDVVPLVINELPHQKNNTVIQEPVSQSDETALRLTIHGITVEITNQATQSVIQNTFNLPIIAVWIMLSKQSGNRY